MLAPFPLYIFEAALSKEKNISRKQKIYPTRVRRSTRDSHYLKHVTVFAGRVVRRYIVVNGKLTKTAGIPGVPAVVTVALYLNAQEFILHLRLMSRRRGVSDYSLRFSML